MTDNAFNGRPAGNGKDLAKPARALHRAVKRVAALAMRHDDAAAAANEALALLRCELLYRFELLASRQRQPDLIVPEPLRSTHSAAQQSL